MEKQEVCLLPLNEMLVQCWVTLPVVDLTMCSSRKYPYSPPQKGLEFPGRWGFCKAKKFKEMYQAELEFPEGCGGLKKIPFCGGCMDIFWNCTILISRN